MLVSLTNCSLDGFTEDASGDFRMYEAMAVWETDPSLAAESPVLADFAAVWQDSDKVVYSRTLVAPVTARTRIERDFEPAAVERTVASATTDVSISGPELAGQAIEAGLVDEILLVVHPVVVGAGKPAFPPGLRLDLELLEERHFAACGVVSLRYRVKRAQPSPPPPASGARASSRPPSGKPTSPKGPKAQSEAISRAPRRRARPTSWHSALASANRRHYRWHSQGLSANRLRPLFPNNTANGGA